MASVSYRSGADVFFLGFFGSRAAIPSMRTILPIAPMDRSSVFAIASNFFRVSVSRRKATISGNSVSFFGMTECYHMPLFI